MSEIVDLNKYFDGLVEQARKDAKYAKEYYDKMPEECKRTFWETICLGGKGEIMEVLKDIMYDYYDE